MTITLAQAKNYLRVDHTDDDALITTLIEAATELCADVARQTAEEFVARTDEKPFVAVMYVIAYLYEHREEADHNALLLTIRALMNDREAKF